MTSLNVRVQNTLYFVLFLTFLGILVYMFQASNQDREYISVTIGNKVIKAWPAKTEAEQQKGLAGVGNLSDDQGMVFIYSQKAKPTFWMKGMVMAIDIIWIRDDRVIAINQSLSPDDGKTLYQAPEPINYVLEVAANWTKRYNVKIGDVVSFDVNSQ